MPMGSSVDCLNLLLLKIFGERIGFNILQVLFNNIMYKYILIFLFMFACSIKGFSQTDSLSNQDTSKVVVITYDGKEFIGKILSDDGRELLILTDMTGKVFVKKENVKRILKVTDAEIVNNEYVEESPFTTRYAFTNNALPIKKGQNYAMWNLFGPEVHFAVTSRLNLGVMSTWLFSPVAVAAKYTFSKEGAKLYASAGTLLGTSGWINSKGFGGLHWLSLTKGNRKNNFTLSGGWGYMSSQRTVYVEDNYLINSGTYTPIPTVKASMLSGPLFSASGIVQIGSKTSFVFDNMLLLPKGAFSELEYVDIPNTNDYMLNVKNNTRTSSYALIMAGMRFKKTDFQSIQVCLAMLSYFIPEGDSSTIPLPMVTWFRRF